MHTLPVGSRTGKLKRGNITCPVLMCKGNRGLESYRQGESIPIITNCEIYNKIIPVTAETELLLPPPVVLENDADPNIP